jgi:hypothetical protein
MIKGCYADLESVCEKRGTRERKKAQEMEVDSRKKIK